MKRNEVVDLLKALTDASEEEYLAMVDMLHAQCLDEDGGRCETLSVECGSGPEAMTAGRALANLALLYPYRAANVAPPPERFVRSQLDAKSIEAHINATIVELYDSSEPNVVSQSVAATTNFLGDTACAVTGRVGTSVSIIGLLEMADSDPRVAELLDFHIPAGELDEIEKAADSANAELIERLRALPGEYGRLLRCGAAINADQFRQAFLTIGVKPGLMDGELIPEPVDTSYLRGLRGVEDYYVCAVGARKALTTNYKQVKTSGYLARKLILLVANHNVDPHLEDCGTQHGIRTMVQSEDHAKRLVGRYMTDAATPGAWEVIQNESEALGLVGANILLRSPITCGGTNGVCHVCYGELARMNRDIHAGVYGVLVISEQVIQRLLSSKHLLKARPVKIQWPEEFLHAFSVERADVIAESAVDRIYVRLDDTEVDEDEERKLTSVFTYRVAGKHGRQRITTPVPIYLDEEAWGNADVEDGEMIVTPVQETPVFHVPTVNSDLSEALYAIFSLIEREEPESYHVAYATLMELLAKSNLRSPSVHAEMILRALTRDPYDHLQRPDFSSAEEPPHVMLKLTPAILASPSVSNSLAFERVRAQLTGAELFRKREKGVLDVLFGG